MCSRQNTHCLRTAAEPEGNTAFSWSCWWSVRRWVVALAHLAVIAFASNAVAHVELLSPQPRERARDRRSVNSDLKRGPCGQQDNERTERVSEFEPGQTIEVRFLEYVNHTSYYRVAFDVDGDDDLPVFTGRNVSDEGDDPLSLCPVDGRVILAYDFDDRLRGEHTLEVTLPNVECNHCTLQVVQFMYGAPRPYYFQCADLVLRRRDADAGAPNTGNRTDTTDADAGGPNTGNTTDADAGGPNTGDTTDADAGGPEDQDTMSAASTPRLILPSGLSESDFVAPRGCWASIPVADEEPGQRPGNPEPASDAVSRRSSSGGCSLVRPPRPRRKAVLSRRSAEETPYPLGPLLLILAALTARRRRSRRA